MPAATKKTAAPAVAQATKGQQDYAAGKVDPAQALKAFKALVAYTANEAKRREDDANAKNVLPLDGPQGDLKDRSNTVYLQIGIKQLSPEAKVKPVRIPVPNAVHKPGQVSVCLLVKDPQRQYKDLLVEQKITSVARVVGVTKLKGKFKPFEARRDLVKDHDIFLSDSRIVPLIPKICGNVFFDAKKNPVPVDVTHTRHLKKELDAAISSAYFLQNKGSTTSIKLGYLSSHTPEQLQENLVAVIPAVVSKIAGGWNNVQNVVVKTGSSTSLPIWNCSLGMGRVVPVSGEEKGKKAAAAAAAPAKAKKAVAAAVTEQVASPATKKGKAAATPVVAAASPKTKVAKEGKGKAAATKTDVEAAAEDAALELSPSASEEDEEAEEDEGAGDVSVDDADKKKKPSPRKTRSATAAATTRRVTKDKVDTPTKKTSTTTKTTAAAAPAAKKAKTTSSTTRAATGKGKAKK